MRLPTVRVTHPTLGCVTINAADFGPGHELCPEQAADFDPVSVARFGASSGLDPAVRDLAASLMLGLTAARLQMAGQDWAGLSGQDQLAALRDAEADVGDLLAIRQARKREGASSEPVDRTPMALSVKQGPRGLWFVMDGGQRVSKGFLSESDAAAERARMATA